MDDLISKRALYERAATLEAQAMDYLRKLTERDGEKISVEWKIWSAVLTERIAFKHDVYDAPAVRTDRKKGKWAVRIIRGNWNDDVISTCSECGTTFRNLDVANYCPNCGLPMEVEE